jgi:quercetin 2,3-dioxygenase
LKGSIAVGTEADAHDAFHTLVLSSEGNETGVAITAKVDNTELILVSRDRWILRNLISQLLQVSGEPLDQTVFQYGPFVMTTREEVQQTLLDYQQGANGFEKAHVWKSEIGGM